ncbi:MAG: PAS domain S-box protein [Candidatus Cloacimonetes bacterium]|nr:PAS domain S-box protein [Candidatus Cloacimonadota bacterium]
MSEMRRDSTSGLPQKAETGENCLNPFTDLYNRMREGWVRTDKHGRITSCNLAFMQLVGYKRPELIGMSFKQLTPQPEKLSVDEVLANNLPDNSDSAEPLRLHFHHRDGRLLPVEIQFYAMHKPTGKPDGAWAIIRNLSSQQQQIRQLNTLIRIVNAANMTSDMQAMMARIRDELGTLIDTTNFYIALYDNHTDSLSLPFHTDRKDRFESFPAGKTLTAYVIHTGKPLMADAATIERLAAEGHIDIIGNVAEMWLGVPLRREKQIIGVVVVQTYSKDRLYTQEDLDVLQFVSEQIAMAIGRQQAEDELRTSEERLRTTIDGLDESVYMIDYEMRLVLVNKALRRRVSAYGWKGDILGANAFEVLPFLSDKTFEEYRNVFESGQSLRTEKSFEVDGRVIWTRTRKLPLLDNHGLVRYVLTVVQDVSEHREAERALLQAQKMEAMGTLAGGIAHDFNNILSVVLGYAEMAHIESTQDSVRHSIEEISQASKRAKGLVGQILSFSRQEKESLQQISMNQITREVLRMLRASLPSTVLIKRQVTSKRTVAADSTRIHQIIMNLCTNAFHAMQPDGGILSVEMEDILPEDVPASLHRDPMPEFVRLRVSDTGSGIPIEQQLRIFEPYYTTKAKGEGTGLGLAIIHSIVASLNGKISLHSILGAGTTFTVILPASDTEIGDLKEEIAAHRVITPTRILFVDDEPMIVSLSKTALERYGYTVTEFTSSSKAEQAFELNPDDYDLVITDMTMPHPTGIELVHKLRAIRSDIPVIMCTGYNDLTNKEALEEANIKHVLLKPIPTSAYVSVIEELRAACPTPPETCDE